jgi:hypothetical protein
MEEEKGIKVAYFSNVTYKLEKKRRCSDSGSAAVAIHKAAAYSQSL